MGFASSFQKGSLPMNLEMNGNLLLFQLFKPFKSEFTMTIGSCNGFQPNHQPFPNLVKATLGAPKVPSRRNCPELTWCFEKASTHHLKSDTSQCNFQFSGGFWQVLLMFLHAGWSNLIPIRKFSAEVRILPPSP